METATLTQEQALVELEKTGSKMDFNRCNIVETEWANEIANPFGIRFDERKFMHSPDNSDCDCAERRSDDDSFLKVAGFSPRRGVDIHDIADRILGQVIEDELGSWYSRLKASLDDDSRPLIADIEEVYGSRLYFDTRELQFVANIAMARKVIADLVSDDRLNGLVRKTVVLKDFGPNKIAVIKAVMELTPLGLKESKVLVEAAPTSVKEAVTQTEALETKDKLENAGATVDVV
jgi:large subunit ribosomal protein L7/L12